MLTYKDSGVDIEEANKLVRYVSKRVEGIGGYASLTPVPNTPNLYVASTTDGVGTKILIAKQMGIFNTIGIDLVAMNVNDIICSGASPSTFLDYIACGNLSSIKYKDIIDGVVKGCEIAGVRLGGGETAEMPGVYDAGDFDIAGFCFGFVNKEDIIDGSRVAEGDTIIGVASSGIHSNGFSLVRRLIKEKNLDINKVYFANKKLGEELLTPTLIYTPISRLFKSHDIKAIAHITGGGIVENLKRVINKDVDAIIETELIEINEIFEFLFDVGEYKDYSELYNVFNMGIGMILIVESTKAIDTINNINKLGFTAYIIGKVVSGSGKVVLS